MVSFRRLGSMLFLDRVGMTGKYDFLSYMGGVVGNFEELAGTSTIFL